MALQVIISNVGRRTSIRNYSLLITPAGEEEFRVSQPFDLSENSSITAMADPQFGNPYPYYISGQDSLSHKTNESIGRGGMMPGFLIFYIARYSIKQVLTPGTEFVIEFEDDYGNKYSAELKSGSTLPHVPGHINGLKSGPMQQQ